MSINVHVPSSLNACRSIITSIINGMEGEVMDSQNPLVHV